MIHTWTFVKELPRKIMSCYPQRLKIHLTEKEHENLDSENVSLE
jgi:hypothetical protein